MSTEFLTTHEVADLLRIKLRKVYELASTHEIPSVKAKGKLLFPRQDILAWLQHGKQATSAPTANNTPPAVLAGSYDPLLEWAIKASGCDLALKLAGSQTGLDEFTAGRAQACGLHLAEPLSGGLEWNVRTVANQASLHNAVLVNWAWRNRGFIFAPGKRGSIRHAGHLKGMRLVRRPDGSGTQVLMDWLLQQNGLDQSDVHWSEVCHGETDAIACLTSGQADVALSLQAMAGQYGLEFIACMKERFDLLVHRKAWFDPHFQQLWAFTQGEFFVQKSRQLQGYDLTQKGQVVWNA